MKNSKLVGKEITSHEKAQEKNIDTEESSKSCFVPIVETEVLK